MNARMRRAWAKGLAGGLVLAAAAASAAAGSTQASWRDWMAEETGRPPAMAFPYQGCFEAAAARHDLPVTLLLAVAAFSLSLLGTFLVRSGVLTSVHAFATDPERGLFILMFLALVVGLYWALPRRPRQVMILVASLVFYGFWRWEFLPVMLASTVGSSPSQMIATWSPRLSRCRSTQL